MIRYQEITRVHLEISSLCNASCPWCPRNFWGYSYNAGFPETNLTLSQSKKIFTADFLRQLKLITINGNFGDIVMNPEGHSIVEYFKNINPDLEIVISTNGSARSKDFWLSLAQAGAKIIFCLDGLEDTHHLYRQNTVYQTVINNAQTFINAGGYAIWKMIKFKHNVHQTDQAKNLSITLGFKEFELVESSRTDAPVYDNKGNLSHILGDYKGETSFPVLFHKKRTDVIMLEDIISDRKEKKTISCETKNNKEIYITCTGEVYPCCYTGLFPKTYGHGQYHQAANAQIAPFILNNNALEHTIKECIEWFSQIEQAWMQKTYGSGRLIICDDNCGN